MTTSTDTSPVQLQGWKVIANYLGCTVRTAQRWELELGLPVRRVLRHKREAVYAAASELELWKTRSRSVSGPEHNTLAILPFHSADGIGESLADELISSLYRAPTLTVIARTSSFAMIGRPVAETAALLGATALLEGDVQREAGRVRLRLRLLSSSGSVVWSDVFERDANDLLSMQDAMTEAITSQLRIRLYTRRLRRPVSGEVYSIFLRARSSLYRMNQHSLFEAAGLFDQCIEREPEFADALAERAAIDLQCAILGIVPPAAAIKRGKALLESALAADSTCTTAKIWLARVLSLSEFKWDEAERLYVEVLEEEVNNPFAPYFYGSDYLRVVGRFAESIELLNRVVSTDPVNPLPHLGLALGYARLSQLSRALEEARRALELTDSMWVADWVYGALRLHQGDATSAIPSLERAVSASPKYSWANATLASALWTVGRSEEANSIYSRAVSERAASYVPATTLAFLCLVIGRIEASIDWFETALSERDPVLAYAPLSNVGVFVSPEAEFLLRSLPRWAEIVKRMSLGEVRVPSSGWLCRK